MPARRTGRPAIDLTGRDIGRLTVLGRADRPAGKTDPSAWWRVRCDCGHEYVTSGRVLRRPGAGMCRRCQGRQLAASQIAAGHTSSLSAHVWVRTCPTCLRPFRGTARQMYCRPAHRPKGGQEARH